MRLTYLKQQRMNTMQKTLAMRLKDAKLPSIEELNKLPSMASRIRQCATITSDRGVIAKHLGIKYQWVRNVLIQDLAKKQG